METEKMKKLVDFIASFLIEITGNEIFDRWQQKRKIEKILKKDINIIKNTFYVVRENELYKLIEEYIMFSVFEDITFYSPGHLTTVQENELWEKFQTFFRNETGEKYVNIDYKDRLIRCVNSHNSRINEIMDNTSRIHIKLMNRQHKSIEDSLNCIINTLNTNTKLQDKDDDLDYMVEQLETIIKSFRYDVNQLRKMQIISMCGAMAILSFMGISVPNALKDFEKIFPTFVMCFFLGLVAILLLIFWWHISKKRRYWKMS